jgi:hypothetical protein
MKLVYDDQAFADLDGNFGWIAQDRLATAKIVIERVFSSTELLISFPFMGHAGRDPHTFEWGCAATALYPGVRSRSGIGARCRYCCASRSAESRERRAMKHRMPSSQYG